MQWILPASLSLLAALSGETSPGKPDAALTPTQIAETATPSVVRLVSEANGRTLQASGFVAGASGLIVTNLHALDGATRLTVTLPDGRRLEEVSVIAFDVEQDLVVVKAGLPAGEKEPPSLRLGRSSSVRPGDAVLVISNPLGLERSVTEGIVSAWREPHDEARPRWREADGPLLPVPTRRLLQISAAISPGSSGGPVFNDRAEVIGVAMAGLLYGMADINFAVPIDDLPALLQGDDPMDLATLHLRVDAVRLGLARPWLEKAQLAHEQADVQTAERLLERALQFFPAYEEALLLLARIRMDQGALPEAERLLVKAVEASEESAEAWYRIAELYDVMAADTGSLSTMARAEAAFEKALDLDQSHTRALFGLALLHVRRGNLAEAEDLLRRASDADSEMVDAHAILGLILLKRGDPDQAEAAFRQAVWEDPDHPLGNFGLAQVLTMREDNSGKATEYWKRFLEVSRGDPSLAREREVALRIVRMHFPLIDAR